MLTLSFSSEKEFPICNQLSVFINYVINFITMSVGIYKLLTLCFNIIIILLKKFNICGNKIPILCHSDFRFAHKEGRESPHEPSYGLSVLSCEPNISQCGLILECFDHTYSNRVLIITTNKLSQLMHFRKSMS